MPKFHVFKKLYKFMSDVRGNIVLKIQNGQGLSQAIDSKLDSDLKQDVKFNLNDWKDIFTLIKDNQVAANKNQFGSKDTDIRNGKHFVVNQGNYEISQNVWQQILDKAKAKLGITTTAETEPKPAANREVVDTAKKAENPTGISQQTTENLNAGQQQTKEIANKIKEYLEKNNIEFDELDVNFKKDLVNKYKNITALSEANGLSLSDEQISERINNYAKGYLFHKFEQNTVLGTENNDYKSDCSNAKNLEELKSSYEQFGKEYVTFFDKDENENATVNVHEMFYQELTEHYLSKGLNRTQATQKAIETTKKFQEYNINNLPDENNSLYTTDEMDLFVKVLGKITTLDADGDNELSAKEAGAYLMSVAQMNDEKNNITSIEYIQSEFAIQAQGMNKKNIIKDFGVDRQQAKNILEQREKFNNNLAAFQNFIINGKLPQQD